MWTAYRRQRRRIAVTMLLVTLTLIVGFLSGSGWLWALMNALGGPSLITATQAAATVLIGAYMAILFILRFSPALRQQCEVVAAAALLFELLFIGLNWLGAPITAPLLSVCVFVGMALAIDHLIYGRVLDVFNFWRPLAATHDFTVIATPHAAWNAIVPRPETVSTHWIGALTEVAHTRERDVFVARYRLGDGTVLQKTLTFLESDHPNHFRYHFEPETTEGEERFGAGFFELSVTPVEDGITHVKVSCEYTALRARTALMLWMDDWLGSEGDAVSAFIDGRPDQSLHTKLWGEVLRQAS